MKWRFLGLLIFAAGFASADERILTYHSDILVREDGWIEVAETIRVRAEGQQIRRGIYRDYPTDYKDNFGNRFEVIYEPRSLTRDGRPETFKSEKYHNGMRTYFGSSDRLLEPGEHVYVYHYAAGRMLGYFADKDELWWNVTGDGWTFPIDSASAAVTFSFDPPVESLEIDAWQGSRGSKEQADAGIGDAGQAIYRATRTLGLNEQLSLSVRWPKGFVTEPTALKKLTWLLADNLNLLIALAGLIAMLSYYVPVWKNYGRDPPQGVIFARYEPPDGFSPASLRYVANMGYDNKVMTAGVISLAVKGCLRIDEDGGEQTLVRRQPGNDAPVLATGEKELYEALFRDSGRVTLVNDNHVLVGDARSAHKKSLRRDYYKRFFETNGMLNLPAVLISVIASLVALGVGPSFGVVTTIALMLLTIVIFAILMKRPTGLGRALLDEAAGFREYLEVAEKDELNLRNPPEKTPQLFERYLPFALALGVEQQWAERFSQIFAALKGRNDAAWHPAWYNGTWNSLDLSVNTASMSGNLGSAISSSVSPPGSSSASGGGFSGGGGGGGGGGGW